MATDPPALVDMDARRAAAKASLNRVQRRVGAIGFFFVAIHGALGVIFVAHTREDQGRHGDAIGLRHAHHPRREAVVTRLDPARHGTPGGRVPLGPLSVVRAV
jgi:hypothetical protein